MALTRTRSLHMQRTREERQGYEIEDGKPMLMIDLILY